MEKLADEGVKISYNQVVTYRSELGKKGEDFACKYLVDKGFRVIERNFRESWGELDVIIIAPDKTLVFVEVKTIKNFSSQGIKPEEQMTRSKLEKFKRTATLYANDHSDLVNDRKGWRLDLIALTRIGNDFLVRHYKNIF